MPDFAHVFLEEPSITRNQWTFPRFSSNSSKVSPCVISSGCSRGLLNQNVSEGLHELHAFFLSRKQIRGVH